MANAEGVLLCVFVGGVDGETLKTSARDSAGAVVGLVLCICVGCIVGGLVGDAVGDVLCDTSGEFVGSGGGIRVGDIAEELVNCLAKLLAMLMVIEVGLLSSAEKLMVTQLEL